MRNKEWNVSGFQRNELHREFFCCCDDCSKTCGALESDVCILRDGMASDSKETESSVNERSEQKKNTQQHEEQVFCFSVSSICSHFYSHFERTFVASFGRLNVFLLLWYLIQFTTHLRTTMWRQSYEYYAIPSETVKLIVNNNCLWTIFRTDKKCKDEIGKCISSYCSWCWVCQRRIQTEIN